MKKKIGIIGLGTVGEATVRSLRRYGSLIEKRTSLKIDVVKICDARGAKRKLAPLVSARFTKDPYQIINDPDIDIVVELIGGIKPAKDYILSALKAGKDVVTANKALFAGHGKQILHLAQRLKRNIGFEASVCGAIPLIRSISDGLVGCEVRKLYGILNGTTNYVLCKMAREKIPFREALQAAYQKGYAERRPRLDIEGFDSQHKLSILSYLCFGVWPDLKKVHTEGISSISLLDVLYTKELSYTIKLLAVAKRDANILDLRVHPTLLPADHPLSQVAAAFNAVWVDAHPAGELLFHGEGAGGVPTSSSVVSDIVHISFIRPRFIREWKNARFKNIGTLMSRYYIRFMAQDRPGVLARVSKILAQYNISIASVTQKERKEKKTVPIVMITHKVKEADIRRALVTIGNLSVIREQPKVIRIEDL